jgi:hypothetical protein
MGVSVFVVVAKAVADKRIVDQAGNVCLGGNA